MVSRKGSTIPSISISWHNIQVFSRKPTKFYECNVHDIPFEEIIHRVSGSVESGQLLAIMGASGAGKTTLLNVLTARNISEFIVKGVVKLNGRVADIDTITSISAYVQQTDIFLPFLTVREHLCFQAKLRMSENCTQEERINRIDEFIHEFGLMKCAELRIGGSSTSKGISGGEAKRLAFASELFSNPSIMFCDEPTSGLDSFMAESVIHTLKKLSSEGRTIICTIHQPSSQVFELFEQLLLLADGRVAYMGSINNALTFFETLGYKCPQNYNPSDFYISQLASVPGKEMECKEKIIKICEQYIDSTYGHHMKSLQADQEKEDSFNEKRIKKKKKLLHFKSRYKVSFCPQFLAVFYRSLITAFREPIISQIRILQSFTISLILGLVYWQQNLDQRGVMNINGALFLLITNMSFQNSLAVINTFCSEMPLYLREHHSGMYRSDVYFISKMLAEVPVFLVIPIIFVSTYYFMVGFNPHLTNFFIAILIAILITQSAVSFGYLMSCVSSSATMAASIGPPLIIPLILFGGFFLNNESIPKLLLWIKYISWFYYGFENLIINQWSNIEHISCPNVSNNSTNISMKCLNTGKDVIKQLDFNEENFTRNFLMLFVLLFVIRFLAFIALYIKSKKR